jgi:2-C-methyl-D-erythritol 4-phosphate cytidylyltransferase
MHVPWAIILPAAGRSTRFGSGQNKLQADLGGQSVLLRSLNAFLDRPDIAWIGVALNDQSDDIRQMLRTRDDPRLVVCTGGTCRADSVRQALSHVPESLEWVGVHDAARPMVSQPLIDRVLSAAFQYGAAAPAMPVHSTIKQAIGPLPAPIQSTLQRDRLWAMQTPQIMRRADLLSAYAHCPLPLEQVTDDVQLLEWGGQPVWLVEGEQSNLKITTAMDLRLARYLMDDESEI